MSALKGLIIAFSMYSKIPTPFISLKREDMKYHLIFFPWVGAVIAGIIYLWNYIALRGHINHLTFTLIAVAIPFLVTGGFHVDGFMDTMDAIKSYKPREEKLEILKDPHIGAFSVISLATALLIYVGAINQIGKIEMLVYPISFILVRALSGIGVFVIPKAKNDGMLHTFSNNRKKYQKIVIISLIIEFIIGQSIMIIIDLKTGIVLGIVSLICFIYYRYKAIKEFGGTTGDVAGFFVTYTEIVMAIAAAVCTLV